MPRTAITPQVVTFTGAAVAYEAANVLGNSVRLGSPVAVHVKNASGGSVTVTLPTPGTVSGLAIADHTVAVPAAGDRIIKLEEVLRQSDDFAHIDYSAVTSVTVAALYLS